MDSKVEDFLKTVEGTVPFVISIRTELNKKSFNDLTLTLACIDDISICLCYSYKLIENAPHEELCNELRHEICRMRMQKEQEQWQALKQDAACGIALCTVGEFSLRRSIVWPPAPSIEISWPRAAMVPALLHIPLRTYNNQTRVAIYTDAP